MGAITRPPSPAARRRLGQALALACLLLLASATSAHAGATGRASIIGGRGVAIDDYPSLAFVLAEEANGEGFSCTGTVIAPRVVLTAGHCVYDLESKSFTPASEYRVITGVANGAQARPHNEASVQRALLNPGFNSSTLRGDAGLL
ncbi:MAG TPA: trypsin-like serine protease, partial [Solirubrobacterales bacterium]|nr:trypsin-like serine protease [Solirubrobacterales bacterium]